MAARNVFRLALMFALVAIVPACAGKPRVELIEVKVPVPIKAQPPEELRAPLPSDPLPDFVPPTHAGASSALTPEGEQRLKGLILDLWVRLKAWEAWADAR